MMVNCVCRKCGKKYECGLTFSDTIYEYLCDVCYDVTKKEWKLLFNQYKIKKVLIRDFVKDILENISYDVDDGVDDDTELVKKRERSRQSEEYAQEMEESFYDSEDDK